jgi:hypothetical protein
MRITVIAGLAKSLRPPPPDPEFPDTPPADLAAEVAAQLKRLKWFCWHGPVRIRPVRRGSEQVRSQDNWGEPR